jgi:uncharacterized membrane protein YjjB (DUF3815 family)
MAALAPDTADDSSCDGVLKAELMLGELLFSAGAPGQRIIDSITFLNGRLDGGRQHIFLGFEALMITLERDGVRRAAMCGYPLPTALNGRAIQEISRYLRSLPGKVSPAQVIEGLSSLDLRHPAPSIPTFAALALFTVIFGYFNKADAGALLIIALAALIAALAREQTMKRGFGYYISILTATLAATLSAALLLQVLPTTTPLVAMLIPCIFLVPGFQLINSGWEILRNHMHIGIPRLMVYLNVLGIMGVGVLLVLLFYDPGSNGAGISLPFLPGLVIDTLLGAIAALCFCILMNASRQLVLLCLFCGAAGRLVRTLVVDAGGNSAVAVFCGILVITVMTMVACRYRPLPVALPIVAASVQFIPGYYAIITLQSMAQIISIGPLAPYPLVATMISSGILTLYISAAIVFGTLIPLIVLGRDQPLY